MLMLKVNAKGIAEIRISKGVSLYDLVRLLPEDFKSYKDFCKMEDRLEAADYMIANVREDVRC